MTSENTEVPRSLTKRVLHTTAEVLLSLVFAGGFLMVLVSEMCRNNHQCNDFGGVAFFVIGFIITIFVWSGVLSLFRRFRNRQQARTRLDTALVIATVGLWAWLLINQ